MAGGEGIRLQPLSVNMPKPMTRLFDRPVMEYTIELLKRQGITDIAATLYYLPQVIAGHFGDGSAFGVKFESFIETEPLGTAGSVGLCRDFVEIGRASCRERV